MKTLGRILIILLAAAIVIGGAYALLQSSAGQALVGQPIGLGGENGNRPDFANGQDAQFGERRGEREGHGGSWAEVVSNFIKIAVVVVAVQVVWSIGRTIKRSAEKRHRLQVSRSSS
jgi:large-conductance mechanosensitive channel